MIERSNRTIDLGFLLTVLLVTSCAPSATFQVLRPARINARDYGGTMTVQPFGGPPEAAEPLVRDLRDRVQSVEGEVVTYVKSGAGLLLHGKVDDYDYDERLDQRAKSCSRSAGFGELRYSRSYICYEYIRYGTAHVRITFEATASKTGARVLSLTLEDTRHVTERRDEMRPPPIDGQGLLVDLRRRLTERFARVVLPWREKVKVTFGRCGEARDHCERGVEEIQKGQFKRARSSFRRALKHLREADARPRRVAEVYYNLGLAHEYSAEFERAEKALRRASKLDPRRAEYQLELENVRRMQKERAELIRQGH